MNKQFIESVKVLFNEKQFHHLGIESALGKEKYYQNLGNALFYAENTIKNILIPYIIKIESILKTACEQKKLHFAINKLKLMNNVEFQLFCKLNNWDWEKMSKLSKNSNDHKNIILLLNLFREIRNIIVHGQQMIFSRKFSDINKKVLTLNKSNLADYFSDVNYSKMFNLKNINSIMNVDSRSDPKLLPLLFIIVKLFNHKKINMKIFADIDYELFKFRSSSNITKNVKLYEWIGLKDNWIKAINL